MGRFAVIALNPAEHHLLAEVWKFFPFEDDLQYHYLHPDSSAASELPVQPSFISQVLPRDANSATAFIQNYLSQHSISLLCFASLDAYRFWFHTLGKPALTVYSSKKFIVADLSAFDPASEALKLALTEFPRTAILRREADLFAVPEGASVYGDFHSFQANSSHEVLLTQNLDLISAVCVCHLDNFSVCHLSSEGTATNLAIIEGVSNYIQVLNRLRRTATLALPKPDEQNSTPLWQEESLLHQQSSYSFFAEYYDAYMEHVNYEDWLSLMLGWYKQYSKLPAKKILELACGTANASELLMLKGFEVDACDSSPFMLHMADAKVFKPNLFLNSLTDAIPLQDYDFIFCLFDSINYLNQKAQIKTLFKNVQAALRPGGVFIFDISTLLNSLQNFHDITSLTRVKDGYLVHVSSYEILANKQMTHFTLFRKNGQTFDRFEERHVQRVYRSPELADMIAASGLKLRAIHSPEMRTNLLSKLGTDLDNRYTRLFFVLQKSE